MRFNEIKILLLLAVMSLSLTATTCDEMDIVLNGYTVDIINKSTDTIYVGDITIDNHLSYYKFPVTDEIIYILPDSTKKFFHVSHKHADVYDGIALVIFAKNVFDRFRADIAGGQLTADKKIIMSYEELQQQDFTIIYTNEK